MVKKLQLLEFYLSIAYAVSLPLSLTASWLLLICGLVTWALICFTNFASSRGTKIDFSSCKRIPLLKPIGIFASAVAASAVFNTAIAGKTSVLQLLLEAWAAIFSLKGFLVYFWSWHLFSNNRQRALVVTQCLLSVSAIAGIWGTIQQTANFHPFGYQYLQGTGFLGGPMAFAGQMQIFSLLALGIFLFDGEANGQAVLRNSQLPHIIQRFSVILNQPWLFAFIVIANLSGVLFAGERSAWLGVIAGIILLAAIRSWQMLLKSLVVLVATITLAWFTIPVVQTRISTIFTSQPDVSITARLFLWQEAVTIWQSSPLFGIGIGRFPHFNIPEAIVPGRSVDLNHAHSNYLHILATVGLLGLVAYLWLMLSALRASWCSFKAGMNLNDHLLTGLGAGIFAGTFALMISGIFEYNFGTSQVRLAQWFVLGLLHFFPNSCKQDTVERQNHISLAS